MPQPSLGKGKSDGESKTVRFRISDAEYAQALCAMAEGETFSEFARAAVAKEVRKRLKKSTREQSDERK